MKKKILASLLMVFVFSFLAVNVNAAVTKVSIPNTIKAKAPEKVPSTNDVFYGAVTDNFDFSKVKFAPESGSTSINGVDHLRKIILGELNDITSTSGLTFETTFKKWFTAYCLDNAKKYPEYGLLISDAYTSATDDYGRIDAAIIAAIGQDANVQTAIKNKGLHNKKIVSIYVSETVNGSTEHFYTVDNAAETVAAIEGLTSNVTINLNKIGFMTTTGEVVINATDIPNHGDTTYPLTFTGKSILFEKYTTTSPNSDTVKNYNHALWIIEHTYPTLPLKTAVEEAGADYEELRKEICVLEEHTYDETTLACTGLDALDDYVENYVYATIQYAIWKTTDHAVEGERLGNSIQNVTQLNKLYKYLISEDRNYTNYSTKTFKNKITVAGPGEKAKPVTKNGVDIYGPYKVSYDALAGGEMTLTITNADKTGIRLVDKNDGTGTEISTINKGGVFYIECNKKQKISSVTVSVKLENASVFDPLTDRGRLYQPVYRLQQNVMSGGKIVNKNLETTVELVTNPETGVENVALLLMVTLVAFTMAYLILSYKQKSVQLD